MTDFELQQYTKAVSEAAQYAEMNRQLHDRVDALRNRIAQLEGAEQWQPVLVQWEHDSNFGKLMVTFSTDGGITVTTTMLDGGHEAELTSTIGLPPNVRLCEKVTG